MKVAKRIDLKCSYLTHVHAMVVYEVKEVSTNFIVVII